MTKEKKKKSASVLKTTAEKGEKIKEEVKPETAKKEKVKEGKTAKSEAKKQIAGEKKTSFAETSSSAKAAEDKPASKVDKNKAHPIAEAIKIAREAGREKFDASFEVHFRLGIDTSKGDQQVRGTVALPHGVGKKVRIVAFVEPINEEAAKKAGADLIGNDELIEKIKKTEKTDFDLAIAEPSMMKKMGPIAKILGTRGLMPSPKNDTVAADPAKAVAEFKKGKLSFKNDDTGNLHILIGKKSFDDTKLIENFNALLEIIKKAKPSSSKGIFIKNITLCTSMGPGVKVAIA